MDRQAARPETDEEFGDFVRRERAAVLAIAYALSGDRMLAEDLGQDVFLALHRRWTSVRTYARPDLWIRGTVANLAVSRFRRALAEARAVARFVERSAMAAPQPDAAEIWAAVRTLPRRQAQAVTLFYLEDRPVKEIAQILACAEGMVKALLHQGRSSLSKRLKLPLEEDAP